MDSQESLFLILDVSLEEGSFLLVLLLLDCLSLTFFDLLQSFSLWVLLLNRGLKRPNRWGPDNSESKDSQKQPSTGRREGRHFSCPIRAIIFANRDFLNKILTVKRKLDKIHYSYNVSD